MRAILVAASLAAAIAATVPAFARSTASCEAEWERVSGGRTVIAGAVARPYLQAIKGHLTTGSNATGTNPANTSSANALSNSLTRSEFVSSCVDNAF